jgi:hypothetical protein
MNLHIFSNICNLVSFPYILNYVAINKKYTYRISENKYLFYKDKQSN